MNRVLQRCSVIRAFPRLKRKEGKALLKVACLCNTRFTVTLLRGELCIAMLLRCPPLMQHTIL